MNKFNKRTFIEKSFILLICIININRFNSEQTIIYILITIIFSLALEFLNNKNIVYIFLLFLLSIIIKKDFIYMLPLIAYDISFNIYLTILALSISLIFGNIIILLISLVSIYLSIIKDYNLKIYMENLSLKDRIRNDQYKLKIYKNELKTEREKNIEIAILEERNRISRELHDSIGHLISSSIIQLQAISTINKDENISENLELLQDRLRNGMEDVRLSIHNLYDKSLDLENDIISLFNDLDNIEYKLNYSLDDDLNKELQFDILSIIKESINNTIKHSNSDKISINLISQKTFHSIIIKDNGSNPSILDNSGIGFLSIQKTTDKYNGIFNYNFNNGFNIHISLMKG